jgi:hypothetical protein
MAAEPAVDADEQRVGFLPVGFLAGRGLKEASEPQPVSPDVPVQVLVVRAAHLC